MHSNPNTPQEVPSEGYEVTDLNPLIFAAFLIALFAMIALSCVTIVMVMRGFEESRPSLNPAPGSALAIPGMQIPDEPRLQLDPITDRKRIKEANAELANSYDVISEQPGMERVRIPVDRAMELIAAGKVPYRQAPPPPAEEMADPFAEDAL